MVEQEGTAASGGGAESDLPESAKKRLQRHRYCLTCATIKADGPTHKKSTGHEYRLLTAEEKQQQVERWLKKQSSAPSEVRKDTQARLQEQKAQWASSQASHSGGEPFVFGFGKHKKKSLEWVLQHDPGYVPWCIVSKLHESQCPRLKDALQESGLWEQALKDAEALRLRQRQKHSGCEEGAAGSGEHPEVQKLKKLRQEAEAEEAPDPPVFLGEVPGRKRKRQHKSKALVTIQNCTICGSADHKRGTCGQNADTSVVARAQSYKAAALQRVKRLAAVVARLKYTPLHQRSQEYESRPTHRQRAGLARSFLDLCRMGPLALARVLVEDHLLPNLEGVDCPNAKCEQQSQGYSDERVLGPMTEARNVDRAIDLLSCRNVHYRCKACRCKVPVFRSVPLFERATWPGLAALAFWACVEGIPATTCIRMLNVGPELIRRWYDGARTIIAWDALRRQAKIRFGGLGTATTDIEADESCFFSWKEVDPQTGERVYKWYVWLGVVERGNLGSLWMKPIGVTESRGEPRVPPLSLDTWKGVIQQIFAPSTNAVLMTDSAQAYREVGGPEQGIVEKHAVNHSAHEFSRSISVLKDVQTGERRPGMAGTQFLDHEWRLLKADLPITGLSGRTEAQRERLDSYIRAAQWKRMVSTEDRWVAFCSAAEDWMMEQLERRQKLHEGLHPLMWRARKPRGKSLSGQACGKGEVVAASSASTLQGPSAPAAIQAAWGNMYFERQVEAQCGRHALNNLVGGPQFMPSDMERACQAVLAETGEEEHQHIAPGGWYSHSVLGEVLQHANPPTWRMLSAPLLHADYKRVSTDELLVGVLINHDNVHWSAVVRHDGHLWLADSLRQPVQLSEEAYMDLLKRYPMSFVVVRNDFSE